MKMVITVLVCAILATLNATAQSSDTSYKPPVPEQSLETSLPSDLANLQLENPLVVFLVNIDSSGHVSQSLAIEATHVDLLTKAEEKLSNSTFKPASRNGADVPAELFVEISFYDPIQRAWKRGLSGMPMGYNLNDATERRVYEMSRETFVYKESSPAELDSPLSVLDSELLLVEEIDESVKTGKVVVEYFINHKGEVRFPRIIRSDHDSLTKSVLLTLNKTRFSPPTVDGKPTFVRVRQPFNFN